MSNEQQVSPDVLRGAISKLWTTEHVQFALGGLTQPGVWKARKYRGLPAIELPRATTTSTCPVLYSPDEIRAWAKEKGITIREPTERLMRSFRGKFRTPSPKNGRSYYRFNKRRAS